MALARIITRSQACSRELALDLLARGYAVEIVSPDKVPDNIADLELRVDNGPGDQLIANVVTHDGGRTASLEFVHHLKAPMVNFMRRMPGLSEAVHSSGKPVSFNAAPGIEDKELPEEASQLAPRAVSPATEILPDREVHPGIDPEEGACVVARQVLSPPPVQTPGHCAVQDARAPEPTMRQPTIVPPTQAAQLSYRSAGWSWQAAVTFASVLLLAVVLGLSMRRAGKVAAQSSKALSVEKIAVAPIGISAVDAEKDPAEDPGQVSSRWLPPAERGIPATRRKKIMSRRSQHQPQAIGP